MIGKSSKSSSQRTSLGRLPVGDKGLGRLAALRMGRSARLTTRPQSEPGKEYSLTIDWTVFDGASAVEDVWFDIDEGKTNKAPGSEIEINALGPRLARRDIQRLARSLLLLADPFGSPLGFKPRLIAPAFEDLERRVQDSYFDQAEYHLVAELTDGRTRARVLDWKDEVLWAAEDGDLSDESYKAPSLKFDLWAFLLDGKSFSSRSTTVGEVRDWLGVVGGVHLYDRGLRVQPYGDPGHDWLEMNLRRSQNPELRPSTNNSLGVVTLVDGSGMLVQKTDRSGFVENEAFDQLRRFCMDALEWMAKSRIRARERTRQHERTTSVRSVTRAQENLQKALKEAPKRTKESVGKAVRRLERAREREAKSLRDELQLYRTLATVGTSTAVFAHQSAKPSSQIARLAQTLRSRLQTSLGEDLSTDLERPLELIRQSARSLETFAQLPLYLLNRDKRRSGLVDVNSTVREVCSVFEPFLTARRIDIELQLTDANPRMRGTVAALEGILTNLMTNSVSAFVSLDGTVRNRHILISTEISGDRILLRVLDNGPGVTNISVDDIWLPGQTTVPGGTGLGLTIVRDSALDLGGKASVIAAGELGGAEFIVELPGLE